MGGLLGGFDSDPSICSWRSTRLPALSPALPPHSDAGETAGRQASNAPLPARSEVSAQGAQRRSRVRTQREVIANPQDSRVPSSMAALSLTDRVQVPLGS